jgi:hypothetical protein
MPETGMLPFPTTLRAVSGSMKMTIARHMLEVMLRNQNIEVQPRKYKSTAPKMGPSAGAVLVPKDTIPTKPPLSAALAISATTP